MLAFLAVMAMQFYGPTPQDVVVSIVGYQMKTRPVIKRVNLVGEYATVLTSGGIMETLPVTEPILVRHFSFGWQALNLLNDRCILSVYGFSKDVEARLMRGMPALPASIRPCSGTLKDSGPAKQVEAVRQLMRGPLVPIVAVSGQWAMGSWYGAGGGEQLFQLVNGRWKQIAGGGGAMGVDLMREFGVPQSVWCLFGIYDARCR